MPPAVICKDIASKRAVLARFNILVILRGVDGQRQAVVTGKIVPDEKVLSEDTGII